MATTVEIETVTHQINVPNVVPEPLKTSSMRQNKWLVLIGVEFYMDGNARLSHFSSLEGPIHDLESVREFFADKVGIDNDHILILKSTNPERASVDTDVNSIPKNEPMERDRSEWPTYENILKVLDKVTTSAERGDLVYVYYSGHGGRATTTFPQKKGVRGVDETLVPLDVNCGGRYVRDFEIAALIHKMIQQKGLHVTLIFDSCHSGGATKDQKPNGMVARGSSNLNVQILPTDTSDLSEEDLIAACQAGAMDPSTSETSFWLQPKGYVLLAACLPSQVAYEVDFLQVKRGVFTHWLVDSLRGAAAENQLAKLTHEALHR